MKAIKSIILFVFCLGVQQVLAKQLLNDGPVVKVEVTCRYVSLYTVTSDTATTLQRKVFPKGSVLSISGDNKNSEPKTIYVTVNQAQEELYKEPIKLIAKGRHTVKIRALDKDNNETTLSITYLIVE